MKIKILLPVLFIFLLTATAQAATFVVNSTGDGADASTADPICQTATAGECTLRAAIQQANATAGADGINFNIAGAGVKTIQPLSALPEITEAVVINGYTQTGASVNTSLRTDNAVILIELNGAGAGANADGLRLAASASGSTVRGLIINRFTRAGISLNGSDNNTISGNFIGTDATGTIDLGNASVGVNGEFGSNANDNLIGGTTNAARNIISGNGNAGIEFGFAAGNIIQGNFVGLGADGATAIGNGGRGVSIDSFVSGFIVGGDDDDDGAADGVVNARNYISGNGSVGISLGGAGFGGAIVRGNFIGTDTTGTLARANSAGIATNLAHNAIIGGAAAGAGNLISGNTNDGLEIGNSANMIVHGNRIGTKTGGATALANGGDGVQIIAGGSSNNRIGGVQAGEGNIIAFNGGNGVLITDVANAPTGNSISRNSIFSNGGLGINLSQDAVTPNDAGDADTGANNLQNFPVLASASNTGGATTVQGSLNSTPGDSFAIDFFSSQTCDASGNGEGETFIGTTTATTAASGNASFTFTPANVISQGRFITATATRNVAPLDTSEFSECVQIANPNSLVVTNTLDAGAGSLRQAILNANSASGLDTITFNIPGAGAVHTINVLSQLPGIQDEAVINGASQPGFAGTPLIELNGAGAGAGANGLTVSSSGSTTIRSLIINRFGGIGILLSSGQAGHTVRGCYIGTDASGTTDLGNGFDGVGITSSSNNRIGGSTAATRNVISGNNAHGVTVSGTTSTGNVITGNYIGTTTSGAAALANSGVGVYVQSGATGTIIGGAPVGERNVISGNGNLGIFLAGDASGTGGNLVVGNYIGTAANGIAALGNGNGGIQITNSMNNQIGGAAANRRNVISGNTSPSVADGITVGGALSTGNVILGNYIGTDANGTAALGNSNFGIRISDAANNQIGGAAAGEGNTIAFNGSGGVFISQFNATTTGNSILGNSIYSNENLGIDLALPFGVTANDAGDADTGANNLQNYPVISDATSSGGTRVIGTFNSTPTTQFRLEFFNSPIADDSGSGEGQFFVGAVNVMTGAGGNANFDQTFVFSSPANSFISATATKTSTGDTSEFSVAKQVVVDPTAGTVSVGGRVTDAAGRGVPGARVLLTDALGNAREARTNSFGNYRFADVAAGETYIFAVTHKRYEFAAQVIFVGEESANFNFTASSELSFGAGF